MKTIILDQPGAFRACDSEPQSSLQPGEARVRVHRLGVCGTDLHAFRGKQPFFEYPRILGHELGVEVLEVGENDFGLKPGDHCAIEPYLNCGSCVACRRGKPNCCVNMKVLGVHVDGGMREQLVVPVEKLHASNTLSFDQLALVETIGIGAHAVNRARVQPGETALVIGCGPIGLGAMAMAKAEGADVIALDMSESRLEFCQSALGVEHVVGAGENAAETIQGLTMSEFPTVVFDCTGNKDSMRQSIHFLAHGGRLVYVGLFIGDFSLPDPEFHKRETTLLSSRNATSEDMQHVMRCMENGKVDVKPWITHRVAADAMPSEFESWLEPGAGVVKAVVEWA